MQNKIIAYLDILGFKQLVQHNSLEDLKKIYKDMLDGSLDLVLNNANKNIKDFTKDGWPQYSPNVTIVSDSIIVWNANDSWEGFSGLLILIRAICAMALVHGIPLRGGLVLGEIDVLHYTTSFVNSPILLGNGLTKAFELEKKSQMMGCIVSDEVIGHIDKLMASMPGKSVEHAFKEGNYILKYPIPIFNGTEEMYCLNWVSAIGKNIEKIDVDYMVNDAFSMHNKSIEASDVKMKIRNTIDFIKHCILVK